LSSRNQDIRFLPILCKLMQRRLPAHILDEVMGREGYGDFSLATCSPPVNAEARSLGVFNGLQSNLHRRRMPPPLRSARHVKADKDTRWSMPA
jgi:hypothetical protein